MKQQQNRYYSLLAGAVLRGFVLILLATFSLVAGLRSNLSAMETSTSSPDAEVSVSTLSRAYINPFQERRKFRLFILGDSIGNQLWRGLGRIFNGDREVEIVNWARSGSGFIRTGGVNWTQEVVSLTTLERIDIAVVSFGVSDRRTITRRGKRLRFYSPAWRAIYTARVDAFIDHLRGRKIAVYWVGLPVMRNRKVDADMRAINRLIKGRMRARGVKFINTWRAFASDKGRFQLWGRDRSGRTRRLRTQDGVHFTAHGAEKLASLVARDIKSDLARTKAERNVELVGKEPLVTKEVTPSPSINDGLTSMEGRYEPAPDPTLYASAPRLDVLARRGNIAVPSNLNPNQSVPPGTHAEISTTSGIVAARPKRGAKKDRAKTPAHVKVLLLGEALTAKTGRADDFSWPVKN